MRNTNETQTNLKLNLYRCTVWGIKRGKRVKRSLVFYDENAAFALVSAAKRFDKDGIRHRSGMRVDNLGSLFNVLITSEL